MPLAVRAASQRWFYQFHICGELSTWTEIRTLASCYEGDHSGVSVTGIRSDSAIPNGAVGKYEPVALLARGGMADVHLVVSRGAHGFNKLLVVKRLRPSEDDDGRYLDMFLDEARLVARLKHPNIVDTYDVGQDQHSYLIAMEYLEGQSLARLMKTVKSAEVRPSIWVRIVADALLGLHHAHELQDYDGTPLQIVHRDISPPNIFVTYAGEVKVVDFGIAKAVLNTTHTQVGILKGKFGYMAPEQAASQTLDRRADIFSIGAVLWEAIAGRRLLTGDMKTILVQLLRGEFPTLASIKPGVDARLSAIVERAMAKEPDARFATALEMNEALEVYLLSVPEPPSRSEISQLMLQLFSRERALLKEQIEQHLSIAGTGARNEADFRGMLRALPPSGRTGLTPSGGALFDAAGAPLSPVSSSHGSTRSMLPITASRSPRAGFKAAPLVLSLLIGLAIAAGWPTLREHLNGLASTTLAAGAPVSKASMTSAVPSRADSAVIVPERTEELQGAAVSGPMPSIPSGRGRPRPQVRTSLASPHLSAHALADAHAVPFASALTSPEPERPASAPNGSLTNAQPGSAKTLAAEPSTASLAPTARELPAGSVAPEGIAHTVRSHAAEVRACLERARMDRPDLHGRLTVHATLSPAGRVLSASAAGFEGGARLDRCVVSAFQSWTFPAPNGGVPGQIAYAFVFE